MLLHLENETIRLLSVLSMLAVGIMYFLAWRADPAEDTPKFWAVGFGVGMLVYPIVELSGGPPAAAYAIDAIYATASALFVYGAARYARWRLRPRLIVPIFVAFWGVLALLGVANAPRSWPLAVIDVVTAVVLLVVAAALYQRWRGDRRHGHLGLAVIFAVWGVIRFLPLVHPGGAGQLVLISVSLLGRLSAAALFMYLVQQQLVERLRREAKERQLAEAAAREDGRRLADLIELSSDWAWAMDADLRITYMSPKIQELTGMPPEFYVGKRRGEADASRERDASWRQIEDAMLARQAFRDVPLQSPRRDTGNLIHYELSGKPVFDAEGRFAGYRGVGRDVAHVVRQMQERERAERMARESEHRFESLVELSSDWVWEMDEALRFTYLSPQIYDVSGMPPEFYVGKTRPDAHATTDAASGWATLEAKMQARESFRDLPMRSVHRGTGRAIYYQLSGRPIYDAGGRFCGYRGIGRDVTAQTVSRSTVDAILGGVANSVGTDYFEALVGHLARALEMDIVVVVIKSSRGLDLKTQAIWIDGRLVDRRQFTVTGPAVEAVMAGEMCEYPAGVARAFPSSRWLRDQRIEGLIGTPLRDNTGRPIGALLLEKRSPIHNCDITRNVLTALAPRAAAELQRQVADEQVREAEQRFRTVIDNMSSGLLVKVGDRYTAANQTVADWTGIPVEEIVGMTDVELFLRMEWGEECREAENAAQRQSIETGEPRLWESTARFGDGRVRDLILTSFPISGATGEPAANGVLITDVTELRRAEANLQQTQKMEALGRLAGGVAHDFNNIVGAIQGFARFIVEDSSPDSQAREHAERIVSASARARQLIQQVLTFSRRTEVRRERVSVAAAIAEAMALLEPMAPTSVRIELGHSLPGAVIEADPGQIGQVLINLGVNALDAIGGATGRIVFSVRRERGAAGIGLFEARARFVVGTEDVRAAAGMVDPAQNYVVIRVEDTGGGMTREVAARLFEPFFTTKPPGKGTGLGLPVVHGIVLNHRGAIAITARPGHGTTFDIWLPEAASAPAEDRRDVAMRPSATEPRRVLIVDDDVDFGDMLATAIERLGYEVAVATNAHDALATIDEDAAAWDLIVTDQNMPGLSGLDVIARVKTRRPDLPCILCTADTANVSEDVAAQSGASACLRKPIDAASLESVLKRLLPAGGQGIGAVR